MDKVTGTVKKGLEKMTKTDMDRQEDRKAPLDTAFPTQQQPTSTTGGPDPNITRAADAGDATRMSGKEAIRQPTNQPRP